MHGHMDGNDWEDNYSPQLDQLSALALDEDDDQDLEELPEPTLHSFSEAIKSLDDVKRFVESRGCIKEAI